MRNTRDIWEREYEDRHAIPSSVRRDASKALVRSEHWLPNDATRVVELGCGNGRNLPWLSAAYPTASVIGVEFSQKAISEASEVVRETTNDVSVVEADVIAWLNDETGEPLDLVVDSYFSQHLIAESLWDDYVDGLRSRVSTNGVVYWSGVAVGDEYYSTVGRVVEENVVEDPANNVQKRLVDVGDVWGFFGDAFEPRAVSTFHFTDSVLGEPYRRRVVAGCFQRSE